MQRASELLIVTELVATYFVLTTGKICAAVGTHDQRDRGSTSVQIFPTVHAKIMDNTKGTVQGAQ